jgi:hypothetical protein
MGWCSGVRACTFGSSRAQSSRPPLIVTPLYGGQRNAPGRRVTFKCSASMQTEVGMAAGGCGGRYIALRRYRCSIKQSAACGPDETREDIHRVGRGLAVRLAAAAVW